MLSSKSLSLETQVSFNSKKQLIFHFIGVGKSCILARLIENEFSNEHNVTIGVEFGNYVMRIDDQHII